MNVNVLKLKSKAIIPTKGSEKSAGYDLYACIDHEILIKPHETVKIGTGIALALPDGYFGAIVARSGIATNQGLRPANCIGVCDSDYRGEYVVPLHNDTDVTQKVYDGERIAQLVIMPHMSVGFTEVDNLDSTSRGDGGFGSTGL